MRYPSRQPADRLHLLGVKELFLHPAQLLETALEVAHEPCLSPRGGGLVREGGEDLQVLRTEVLAGNHEKTEGHVLEDEGNEYDSRRRGPRAG